MQQQDQTNSRGLIAKYDELRHIDPTRYFFGEPQKLRKQETDGPCQDLQDIPEVDGDTLPARACSYFYTIEFYAKTTAAMDESQMVALVYRELRRIGPEGDPGPRCARLVAILMGLGRKWFYPDSTCPNLLDENVDWKKLMGQYYEKSGLQRRSRSVSSISK